MENTDIQEKAKRERILAESIVLGKIAAVKSLASRLSKLWELPLIANPQSDQGWLATTQITVKNIKAIITDLETDTVDFSAGNYHKIWDMYEEEDPSSP